MAPVYLIITAGVIGLAFGGFLGLVVGFGAGFLLTLLIGLAVNRVQGGVTPRRVRRALLTNMLANYPDVVREAYPELDGDALFGTFDQAIDEVGRRAATLAPSPGTVWSGPVVLQALFQLAQEQPTDARQRLYTCLAMQIGRDWYAQ